MVTSRSRPRVRWQEVLDYGRRLSEFEIVRAIAADATPSVVRVGEDRAALGPARKGASLERFGPLRVGEMHDGFSVASLARDGASARVELRGPPGSVVLVVSPDGPSGPFDVGPLKIWYEKTDVPFASFEPAARSVRGLFAANDDLAAAWLRWTSVRRLRVHQLPDADRLEVRPDGKLYLRISDACQERCLFCFFYDTDHVDNLVRHGDLAPLLASLDPAGIQQVVLTGGEPTLHPRLPEYVGILVERGFREVILQTNGVRLAEPGYLEQLLPHRERLGLGFSLHSAKESTNDALTTVSKGYFPRKQEALRRAAALGFRSKITLVLSRHNLGELVEFVEMCAELTRGGDAFVQFSLPSFEGRMKMFLETYPRLSELALALPPAFARARELDLRLALCHQCQVPPCIVPDDVQHLESLWFCETPLMWSKEDRAYGPRCGECAMRPFCSGVWRGYVESFGTDELVPFGADEVEARP